MITVEAGAAIVTLRLDGHLGGGEARELAGVWDTAAGSQPQRRVVLDLTGVTSTDAAGIEFLASAYRQGGGLVAGPRTMAIVEHIVAQSIADVSESEGVTV
ncbi:MAG TPA: STAS domain-containing protein [Vicinamibacterales bacterium]|nr:STAS domain-containing protein [Vicinamibacterales bacterium]